MNTKNPIRKYMNWYGKNCVEIASEPAGKALMHYGKFTAQTVGLALAATAISYGIAYVGLKLWAKFAKEDEE